MNIDKDKYLEDHIPHRINLLITFRERFRGMPDEKGYCVRDFFRCSKDSSILMARFFFSELGVMLGYDKVTKNYILKKNVDDSHYLVRCEDFNIEKIIIEGIEENFSAKIIDVLKAANKAVAHINNDNVNHSFIDDIGDEIIFSVIDYLEQKIIEYIYKSKNEYDRVMARPNNNMHRERLVITICKK